MASRVLIDALKAIKLITRRSWSRTLRFWIHVPIGFVCVLLACWGVDRLIRLSPVSFPASVALLILLFFGLIVSQILLGDKKTKAMVRVIDVPAGFALRHINVFFTPSFVLLPLSPPIRGVEVAKIIAVFVLGFLAVLVATAYLVRGLQLITGSPKRTMTERAEELGREDDNIPLTELTRYSSAFDTNSIAGNEKLPRAPSPTRDPSNPRSLVLDSTSPQQSDRQEMLNMKILRQDRVPLTRPQKFAASMYAYLDIITYGIIFLFIGIPVYYSIHYAMPIHLSLNVLAYLGAVALPPRWKQFLHPVLVSSAITVLSIWILAVTHHDTLQDGLRAYSTRTRYLQAWSGEHNLPLPGAGDIFGSVLDVSIVALALPMFQYRNELKRHFLSILVPNFAVSVASLFGYPALCYAVGISSRRSLSFAARSLTLALATPATTNLGGDLNLVAVLCIMSGILGVLAGPLILKWLKIPEDDYVTRGVTLGGNSSAIATALLLVSDPRAAALSSLPMGLFGTVMVALTSVPPIVKVVLSLVGLSA